MEPVFSFLIPVYNAGKFLKETLLCIVKANEIYPIPYEIVCVNDGSTDNSLEILKDFEAKYESIKVVNREKNGGLASVRNTGLKHIRGKWLCFVDADDLVHREIFRILAQTVDDSLDIIYFDYYQFLKKIKPEKKFDNSIKTHDFNENDIYAQQTELWTRRRLKNKPYGYRNLGLVWAKVYNTSFLKKNNLCFIEGMKYEEDLSFNLMCLSCAKKAKKVDIALIHYRLTPNSMSHVYSDAFMDRFFATIPIYKEIAKKYYANRVNTETLIAYRILWELLFSVLRGPADSYNHHVFAHKKETFFKLLNKEPYRDIFSQVNILELDYPNILLAYAVKKKSLIGCIILERMLRLKNKLVNFLN